SRTNGTMVDAGPGAAAGRPGAATTRLGELLVGRGLIDQDQLAEALLAQQASGDRLGRTLVELGAIDDGQLVAALAEQLHLAVADFGRDQPDPASVARLAEAVARASNAIPLR